MQESISVEFAPVAVSSTTDFDNFTALSKLEIHNTKPNTAIFGLENLPNWCFAESFSCTLKANESGVISLRANLNMLPAGSSTANCRLVQSTVLGRQSTEVKLVANVSYESGFPLFKHRVKLSGSYLELHLDMQNIGRAPLDCVIFDPIRKTADSRILLPKCGPEEEPLKLIHRLPFDSPLEIVVATDCINKLFSRFSYGVEDLVRMNTAVPIACSLNADNQWHKLCDVKNRFKWWLTRKQLSENLKNKCSFRLFGNSVYIRCLEDRNSQVLIGDLALVASGTVSKIQIIVYPKGV